MNRDLALPKGFQIDFHDGDRLILAWIEDGKRNGCVTIDFGWRRFQVGYSQIGMLERNEPAYAGRGWREALVQDAVAALRASPY